MITKNVIVMHSLLILIVAISFVNQVSASRNQRQRLQLDDHWHEFKKLHNKNYEGYLQELQRRRVWESNLEKIQNHNLEYALGKQTFTLAMNKFGDLTNNEYRKSLLSNVEIPKSYDQFPNSKKRKKINSVNPLPDEVDWRKQHRVSEVKDQMNCSASWAFSAIGAVEGLLANKTGRIESFSVQQLIDCDTEGYNRGCMSGLSTSAFRYLQDYSLMTNSRYPYEAQEGECLYDPSIADPTISDFDIIDTKIETQLQIVVAMVGPVSVFIDASQDSIRFYKDGVYQDPHCSSTNLNHALLVVGYGKYNEQPYWLVKNSWGLNWGQKGYIWMSRNNKNNCGISSLASFPLL